MARWREGAQVALLLIVTAVFFPDGPAVAQSFPGIHPSLQLRDSAGTNVLESGGAFSLRRTCRGCHDTEYINYHTSHAGVWRTMLGPPAAQISSRPVAADTLEAPELNCLLCHTRNPAEEMWIETVRSGNLEWATTATLANTTIVEPSGGSWRWNRGAFSESGTVRSSLLRIGRPSTDNCALCHGIAGTGFDVPVSLDIVGSGDLGTLSTGEVYSPQTIAGSEINLPSRIDIDRPWDVHAERELSCTDCHHSVNNPAYCREPCETEVTGLKFDARRVPFSAYLRQPDHNLAGQSGVGGGDETRYTCEKCHDPGPTHAWLPYAERHFDKVTCQACHTPQLYAAAVESVDWTKPSPGGAPAVKYRGVEGGAEPTAGQVVDGFEPVLLMRQDADGRRRLAPFNLVTSWYWVAGDPERPISPDSLSKHPSPRLVAEVKSYAVNHSTAGAGWAIRDCRSCHGAESRISQPIVLATSFPDGAIPVAAETTGVEMSGETYVDDLGRLVFAPSSRATGLHVLGHDSVVWANLIGFLAVTAVLFGGVTHAVLRWIAAKIRPSATAPPGEMTSVYTVYERLWHWLQAMAIVLLLVTGLEIHFPALRTFGFALAVRVHDIVGFVVVVNAVLAAFYHFATGEIRHYLPGSKGFFAQAKVQSQFYIAGIFSGQPHPFGKRPDRKFNPLQQIVYFCILNVLLPVQIVTGVLIWGAQRWEVVDAVLGGLTIVAPIHAFGAWMFAAFLLVHVYLTTTGTTPLANIGAMVIGRQRLVFPEDSPDTK